jgi:type IV pilus assembly protein PilA
VSRLPVALLAAGGIGAFLYFAAPTHTCRGLMYTPETAALNASQTRNAAQAQYHTQFGRFARSLSELGPPAGAPDNASAANLISADLAAGDKQGYKFTLTITPAGHTITAAPSTFCGSRTFYADQSLVVRKNVGPQPATARSRVIVSAPGY